MLKLFGYDGAVFSACSSRAESRVSNEDCRYDVVVFRVDDHKFLRETLSISFVTSPLPRSLVRTKYCHHHGRPSKSRSLQGRG